MTNWTDDENRSTRIMSKKGREIRPRDREENKPAGEREQEFFFYGWKRELLICTTEFRLQFSKEN